MLESDSAFWSLLLQRTLLFYYIDIELNQLDLDMLSYVYELRIDICKYVKIVDEDFWSCLECSPLLYLQDEKFGMFRLGHNISAEIKFCGFR